MKRIASIGIGVAVAASLCASHAVAQVQIQPVQPTKPVTKPAPVRPTKPGGPAIQPPRPPKPIQPVRPPKPVKPRPPKPIQPVRPPKPVKPRPPQYGNHYYWNHHYRPPHHIGWNQAMLFTGYYGGGSYLTVRHNIPDLRRYGFDGRTYALYATGRWMVCSKINYRGTCRTYRGRQGSLGSLNGRVSSIRFVGR
jgi:hypothetical protein